MYYRHLLGFAIVLLAFSVMCLVGGVVAGANITFVLVSGVYATLGVLAGVLTGMLKQVDRRICDLEERCADRPETA